MVDAYKELGKSLRLYWHLYGGNRALIASPYLHLSILITAICWPVWHTSKGGEIWAAASINILPNLMGFSIAGMAILLALSSPATMQAITEGGEPKSFFTETIANFLHFILIQTIALLLGFIGGHFKSPVLSAFGVLFLIYAVLAGLAMAMQLFHTARIINAMPSLPEQKCEDKKRQ